MGNLLCCDNKSSINETQEYHSNPPPTTTPTPAKQQLKSSNSNLQIQERQLIKEQVGKKITSVYSILSPPLGTGTFGEVRKAIHKETGMVRALKIIHKQKQSVQQQQALLNEVEIIKKLDHPNILKMYEFYQDDNRFYIVTELLTGGELFDKICDNHYFGESTAAQYMKQILSGVAYCHKMNVVHRDIKPENLILESKNDQANLKIIDFGTSRVLFKHEQLRQKTGTLFYMAPEVFTQNYNTKCDVWSCGVIMYIFLYGMPPFQGKTDKETINLIMAGKYKFPDDEVCNPSNEAKDLINRMLCFDPAKRITAEEALNDQWITNFSIKPELDNKNAKKVLKNLQTFKAISALQQAVWQYIVTQLTTKEEKEELLKTFQALDLNNDGVLSRQELIEGYRKILGVVDVEKEVDQILAIADTNNSGELDYSGFYSYYSFKIQQEFVAYSVNRHKLLSDEKLEQVFKMFDADGSGTIEAEELKEMFNNANDKIDDSIWNQLLQEADDNGDGLIQLSEFKNMMKKLIGN